MEIKLKVDRGFNSNKDLAGDLKILRNSAVNNINKLYMEASKLNDGSVVNSNRIDDNESSLERIQLITDELGENVDILFKMGEKAMSFIAELEKDLDGNSDSDDKTYRSLLSKIQRLERRVFWYKRLWNWLFKG